MDKELVEMSTGEEIMTDWFDFVDDRRVSTYNHFEADRGTLYYLGKIVISHYIT